MASLTEIFTSIEISNSEIRGMVVKSDTKGKDKMLAFTRQAPTGFSRGIIVDMDLATESLKRVKLDLEAQAGITISSATIGISGTYLEAFDSRGVAAIAGKEIVTTDMQRASECAVDINIPSGRRLVYGEIKEFVIDGYEGIKNPLGMPGTRLDVIPYLVHGAAFPLDCIERVCTRVNISIDRFVPISLALARAVASSAEMQAGVLVLDLEAETTSMAIYHSGGPVYMETLLLGINDILGKKGSSDGMTNLLGMIQDKLNRAGVAELIQTVVVADKDNMTSPISRGLKLLLKKPVRNGKVKNPFEMRGKSEGNSLSALIAIYMLSNAKSLATSLENQPIENKKSSNKKSKKEMPPIETMDLMLPVLR